MIEKIIHQNEELAIIIRNNYNKEGVNFVTPKSCTLQVGVLCHKKGTIIKPHIHRNIARTVNKIMEVLYLEEGQVDISFYIDNRIVNNYTINKG